MLQAIGVIHMISSQSAMLILADKNQDIIGFQKNIFYLEWEILLHRAFSMFLFNPNGRLLLSLRYFHPSQ